MTDDQSVNAAKKWVDLTGPWNEVAARFSVKREKYDAPPIVFEVLLCELMEQARTHGIDDDSMLRSLLHVALDCGPKGPCLYPSVFNLRREKWGPDQESRLSRLLYKAASLIESGDEDTVERVLRYQHEAGDLSDEELRSWSELAVIGISSP
jgi:hypothetical protein